MVADSERLEEFAELVFSAREALGLTQEEVGKACGVSDSLVAFWERGERRPRWKKLETLADTLCLNIDDLIFAVGGLPPDVYKEIASTDSKIWVKFVREIGMARKRAESKGVAFSWKNILTAGIEVARTQSGKKR